MARKARKQERIARNSTGKRRVYTRGGVPIVCFGGGHFVPRGEKTRIDPEKDVDAIEFETREDEEVTVTQRRGNRTVRERWARREA